MNPIKAVLHRGWNRLYSPKHSQRNVLITTCRRFVSSVQENAQHSGGSYGNNPTPPSVLTTPPEADQSDSSSHATDDFPMTAPSSHVSPSFMNDPLAISSYGSRCSRNIVDSIRLRTCQQFCCTDDVHLRDSLADTDRLYMNDLKGHFGCVNALCFSNNNQEYLASGGDDKRILLWRVGEATDHAHKPHPSIIKTNHYSNIFTLSFSCNDTHIFSSGNDGLMLTYDIKRNDLVQTYQHLGPVYCVDAHPSCPSVIAAATDDGSIYLIDTRAPAISQEMVVDNSVHSFHSVSINPAEPHLLASGNESAGAALYDLRNRKRVLKYKACNLLLPWLKCDIMSVTFNSTGTKVCVLQKSEPPKVYSTFSSEPVVTCVDDKDTYKNSVTMKTACFAGSQDEYIVTGSDDFRLYWWKIPQELKEPVHVSPYMVIPGHKSIVNQTRYSKHHHLVVSSGVEKFIKVWTHFPLHSDHTPYVSRDPPIRAHCSYQDLLLMSLEGDAISDTSLDSENMEESGRALAFFDQLIQDEHESSSDDDSISDVYIHYNDIPRFRAPLFEEDHEVRRGIPLAFFHNNLNFDYSESDDESIDDATSETESLHCTCPIDSNQVVPQLRVYSDEGSSSGKNAGKSQEGMSGTNVTRTTVIVENNEATSSIGINQVPFSCTCNSDASVSQPSATFPAASLSHTRTPSGRGCLNCPAHVYSDSQEHSENLQALKAYFTKKNLLNDDTTPSSSRSDNLRSSGNKTTAPVRSFYGNKSRLSTVEVTDTSSDDDGGP